MTNRATDKVSIDVISDGDFSAIDDTGSAGVTKRFAWSQVLTYLTTSLFAKLNVVQSYTKQQNFGAVAITSASASIAWNLDDAQAAKHTFTENTTLANPTNMVDGGTYTIILTQHASSPKTLAFGSAYKWPAGTAPTVTATNSAVDILTFVSDGVSMYGVSQLNFS